MSVGRRLRGVLGTAFVWAMAWLPFALVVMLLNDLSEPYDRLPATALMMEWIVWGGFSGAVFALLLMWAERRRTLAQLSAWRVALWGACGAALGPAALMVVAAFTPSDFGWIGVATIVVGTSAALGAACASGTLLLARKAPHELPATNDPALPPNA